MLDPSTFDESTQLGAGIYAAIFVFLDFFISVSVSSWRRKREISKWVDKKS
jgi:hypothetical protein